MILQAGTIASGYDCLLYDDPFCASTNPAKQTTRREIKPVTLFQIISILITLAAAFSYVNYRFIRLPMPIGVMLIALLMSIALILFGAQAEDLQQDIEAMLATIDFESTLLHGMLSFLLFAGALHVNLSDLASQRWIIGVLATLSVIGSTFLIGFMALGVFGMIGIEVPFIYCLVFGALISPTDPIAVLSILKQAGAPKSLETKITGESLFNDGVAVVVFLVLAGLATGSHEATVTGVLGLFLVEAIGGVIFGLGMGWLAFWLLRDIDHYTVEVLVTLALTTGGYALAEALHISAPIAIVVAGLLIGNQGRLLAMSDKTRDHLDTFWELIDEILNAILFLLIGMEVLVLSLRGDYLVASLFLIPAMLLARFVCVGLPVGVLRFKREFSPHVVKILTWGGLRGGISVALVLSLPPSPIRDVLLTVTYIIVIFSIVVQGLTIGPMLRYYLGGQGSKQGY